LHQQVDRRLVKTLLDLVLVILMHRNRNQGLLLSDSGEEPKVFRTGFFAQ
jgi:hypothetical protein